uniref:Integrase catalytic domain-containing protein n=1 Tax=Parascaris equorum TaxID=6256 RepID=A0A914R2U8_PAREQ
MTCRRWNAQPFKLPAFPLLRKERIWAARAFQNVGLDYMGPITECDLTDPCKRWIALFTCLATIAIHLEAAKNLMAEQFLHVMRRFIARNGYPTSIVLDNASYFPLVEQVMQNTLAAPITWRFITQFAPRQGGVYERLVGLTKTALHKAVGRRLLDEEELKTLVVECEAIVNSRPLTYVGSAFERILRPVDFLRPQAIIGAQGPVPKMIKACGTQQTDKANCSDH